MRADLHLHTVYSDGCFTPDEVAARAKANGVELIAFTDHDTMDDISIKRAAAQKHGLQFVRGWEISAYEGATKVHTLGYGCEAGEAYRAFRKRCAEGAQVRTEEALKRINELCSLSLTVADVEAAKFDKSASLHTMHVVRAVAARLNRDVNEVFAEYFSYGKPAYVNLCRPTPEEAIEVIHASGGVASLAHPARIYGGEAFKNALIARMIACGLDGIECNYSAHTESETEYFLAVAKKYGLFVTGGSDFHYEDGVHAVGKPVFVADDRLLVAMGL